MQRMNESDRSKVESEVKKLTKHWNIVAWPVRQWAPYSGRAIVRALALSRLGIEPPIRSLCWNDLFKPWLNTALVYLDFRHLDPATEDAKTLLRENDLEVPEILVDSLSGWANPALQTNRAKTRGRLS